jgi:hypothetical protein
MSGQFHQPNGTKRKCTSRHYLGHVSVTNKTTPFFCQYTELEFMFNFNAVRFTLLASKIRVNLLVQNLRVER